MNTAVAAPDYIGSLATVVGWMPNLPLGTKVKIISVCRETESGRLLWIAREDDKQPAPTLYLCYRCSLNLCPGL